MSPLIFDVESGPLPEDHLQKVKPAFRAPANYRKPEAIAQNIAEQEEAWRERAALDATAGQILCIGFMDGEPAFSCVDGYEGDILITAWSIIADCLHRGATVVGFNIIGWDLPFMLRRSWQLGITPPKVLRNRWRGRTQWHENIIDLMLEWDCGARDKHISLDIMANALGVGQKNGDGKNFADLWKSDKPKAIEYLKNDLQLLRACAERIL